MTLSLAHSPTATPYRAPERVRQAAGQEKNTFKHVLVNNAARRRSSVRCTVSHLMLSHLVSCIVLCVPAAIVESELLVLDLSLRCVYGVCVAEEIFLLVWRVQMRELG